METSPDWFHLPHDDTVIGIRVGDEQLRLTKDNTALYAYPEPYSMMNHVYHVHEDGQQSFIFDAEQLMYDLLEQEFDYNAIHQPQEIDVEAFFVYQRRKLEQELEGL